MSIASEIERLQTAKASLKTSIEAKGVTVPEGATLDDYPALVDSISGGGLMVVHDGMKFRYSTDLSVFPQMDFSQLTSINYMFANCGNSFPSNYVINCTNATDCKSAFRQCTTMITAPNMDLSSATRLDGMFDGCQNLQNLPAYNIPNVTDMSGLFLNNGSKMFTDESLNNVLAMCISATSYTYTKTLASLYITSAQATRCQSLSNYQAFLDAGWTTGY